MRCANPQRRGELAQPPIRHGCDDAHVQVAQRQRGRPRRRERSNAGGGHATRHVESVQSRDVDELTTAVFGRSMTLAEAAALIDLDATLGASAQRRVSNGDGPRVLAAPREAPAAIWVGSIGYERHKSVADFARLLRDAGVELLIDVRELPISRRRGYAKRALQAALNDAGVGYRHVRALGNPKSFRDLYKAGQVEAGRELYEDFLLSERADDLAELATTLRQQRCALMCVEDDERVCHRGVILAALRSELGLSLRVEQVV
jgi:hypothetical protein